MQKFSYYSLLFPRWVSHWLTTTVFHVNGSCWSFSQNASTTSSSWRNQIETFSTLLALCAWHSPVTGEFPDSVHLETNPVQSHDWELNIWKIHAVSWRNHTEKFTTLWPQNISFWLKINIPFFYFTILMPNCLENTLKLWQLYHSCQIFDRINFQNNLTWPNSNTAGISLDCRLFYSTITHRYAKNSPFTWFLYWQLPTDTDFIHFICQFHQRVISRASRTSARHAGSFDCLTTSLILITMDNCRGHCA